MLVSHKHRFIYLKTRKTGGTSTEMALEPFARGDEAPVTERTLAVVSDAGIVGSRMEDRQAREEGTWRNHMTAREIRAAHRGAREHGAREIQPGELRALELRALEVRALEPRAREIQAREVGGPQLRAAQVDIGRVQVVRLGRQRLEGIEPHQAIGQQPVGTATGPMDLVDVGARDGEGEVGQSLACRARPR